jgi:hypothetical protein
MVTVDEDRSATLVVRVWLEGGTDGGEHVFRGRLTSVDTSPGAGGDELTVGLASTPDEVVAAVRSWLDGFTAGTDRDG